MEKVRPRVAEFSDFEYCGKPNQIALLPVFEPSVVCFKQEIKESPLESLIKSNLLSFENLMVGMKSLVMREGGNENLVESEMKALSWNIGLVRTLSQVILSMNFYWLFRGPIESLMQKVRGVLLKESKLEKRN